ncbi:2-hydroxychromene-2-carboxylate isomerase [Actinokineospora fastidiosa]|uniref:2-hydroxychromene-2-carboxylate isomerase n=1 Tax=Actinokineospora fastidiosa TaxID=1816 RepID=A0A918GHA5_9PSEU|nr:DsbA family protein [Actinokineospora fastidiosa]GGS36164.1 2-hydroxychromene-2-carboxylate isomerase [Actinokineospora fastidiosa]
MARKPPRWYFSFRSPYSWLAYRDLMDHHPDVADTLQWRPFWEPEPAMADVLARAGGDFPYVPMSREKHRYILQDVRRLAAERGLSFAWPVDRAPRWEVAHLGYLVAADRGLAREYVAEVYRARWELGLDISDPLTITTIAAELDTDPRGLADAVDDPSIRERGLAALLDISQDGVFGVPFFATGFDKFWGLDRLPAFIDTLRATAYPTTPAEAHTPALAATGDLGHAGGCG